MSDPTNWSPGDSVVFRFTPRVESVRLAHLDNRPERALRLPGDHHPRGTAEVWPTLSGVARTENGGPVDWVLVRSWFSHEQRAALRPSADGSWAAVLPPGSYEVVYRAAGCAPKCHGPYTISA